MSEFFEALCDPETPLLRHALLVGVLASVALGIVGSYVVTRRITYLAAAIAHCVLGGVGAALFLTHAWGWAWCDPLFGATAAAVLSAMAIGWISLRAKEREDTVISAVWSIGVATGMLLLAKTPVYRDATDYLFGSIALVGPRDIWLVLAVDAVVLAVCVGGYPKLLALCFDAEFAELRGVHVRAWYMLLLVLTALTVVLLIRVVGLVLVIALMTLPAAIAGYFARQLWQMMLLAVVLCAAFTTAGIAVSYPVDLPSGPTIVCLAGGAYLLVALGAWLGRLRR